MKPLLSFLLLLALSNFAPAQTPAAKPVLPVTFDHADFSGDAGPGSNVVATVYLNIADGYYINANPGTPNFGVKTELFYQAPQFLQILQVAYPQGAPKPIPGMTKPGYVYEGGIQFNLPIIFNQGVRINAPVTIPAVLVYQPTFGKTIQPARRLNFNIVIPKPAPPAPAVPPKK